MTYNTVHFGNLITSLMQSRNWNKAQLAREMGINRMTLSDMLKRKEMKFETIRRFSKVFGEDLMVHLLAEETQAKLGGE